MTKQEAIRLFDTGAALARALGISRSAVAQWPDELPQRTADEVIGAAFRCGRYGRRASDQAAESPAPVSAS